MRYLTCVLLILSFNVLAQEKEGDLQLPVTDVSQIERQEEELPPSIEEVEMKQKEPKPKKQKDDRSTSSSSDPVEP